MGLKHHYLLLLFVFGLVARGLVKTAFGANVSLALLLSVALYYWLTKRKEASVYDDIARLQAETAAKLDALHGRGDGRVSEIDMAVRKTQFSLRAEDASIVTDRMRQYSMKLGGSRRDRQKFLKRNAKPRRTEEVDLNDPEQAARLLGTPTIEPAAPETKKRGKRGQDRKPAIDKIVEEAVDATL